MQALNDHLRNEDIIEVDSERLHILKQNMGQGSGGVGSKIKEVDETSDDEDEGGLGFNSNNDSGI